MYDCAQMSWLQLHSLYSLKVDGQGNVDIPGSTGPFLVPYNVTSYNSAYVHRRLGRRLGLLGAATRLVATSAPRPGWARGRVTYARNVMRNFGASYMHTSS
jgi:hypothetical protein